MNKYLETELTTSNGEVNLQSFPLLGQTPNMDAIEKLYYKEILKIVIFPITIFIIVQNIFGLQLLKFYDIFQVILITIATCIVLVYRHIKALRKLGIEKFTNENLCTIQRKIFTSHMNINQVSTILKKDDFFNKMKIVESPNIIELITIRKWYSFNYHTLEIKIEDISKTSNTYHVISKPKYSLNIDFGYSMENVMRIGKIFEAAKIRHHYS